MFSAFFAISIVLGKHIVMTGSSYAGTVAENYIAPYGLMDLVAFVDVAVVCLYLISCLFGVLHGRGGVSGLPSQINLDGSVFGKRMTACALCLLVLWLPWLLAYWPGFIFSDTLSSFAQIQGTAALSNHHPVFFTGLIGLGVAIARVLGLTSTAGVGFYALFQMVFQALCYAYLIVWMQKRLGISRTIEYLLVALFGLSPYFASFSIALWKDPLFSSSVVATSVLIAEIVLRMRHGKRIGVFRYAMMGLLMIVTVLIRNNGPLVVAAIAFCALVYGAFHRGWLSRLLPVYALSACVVVLGFIVTGPVYKALGVVSTEKVESYGIPLNQMARVAALGGEMTESDRQYMDSMLPLDQYASKYRPTCTDLLKWDSEFNAEPLESDFWKHWISMGIRNPRVYFEAWEMQTFGFWAANVPEVNSYDDNIGDGVPRIEGESEELPLDVVPHALFGMSHLRDCLPYRSQFISCGVLFWVYLAAFLLMCWLGWEWAGLSIVPVGAVFVSLLIASPIWYWSRYGIAAQMLLPFVVGLFWLACRQVGSGKLLNRTN